MINLGGSMCVKNVRRIVMSDVKCNQCGNKVYPKHHCNKCYATIDRDELKRLQSLEQAPSGLRVYTADEIWAGREYNPQAIPMDMEFIEKEKYICESVKQSPESMIAEGLETLRRTDLKRYRNLAIEITSDWDYGDPVPVMDLIDHLLEVCKERESEDE